MYPFSLFFWLDKKLIFGYAGAGRSRIPVTLQLPIRPCRRGWFRYPLWPLSTPWIDGLVHHLLCDDYPVALPQACSGWFRALRVRCFGTQFDALASSCTHPSSIPRADTTRAVYHPAMTSALERWHCLHDVVSRFTNFVFASRPE